MQPTEHSHADSVDRLDADAVCEQCDTVNPPGTLFCRTCGENLRDQRMRRLARPETTAVAESTEKPRRVLTGLLTLFGLLLIIWVSMKVYDGTVENWLTQQLTETAVAQTHQMSPEEFWNGPNAALFDSLAKRLQENPVSLDEVRSGGQGAAGGLDGRYFITTGMGRFSRGTDSAPIVGYAYVEVKDEEIFLVADFSNRIQVRAKAKLSEGMIVTTNAALRYGSNYIPAMGYARVREDGNVECQGQTATTTTMYVGIAHRVP